MIFEYPPKTHTLGANVSSRKSTDEEWMVGIPEWQLSVASQGSSTVASTADHHKHGLEKPLLTRQEPGAQSVWAKLSLVVMVPAALVAGIVIGFLAACWVLRPFIAKQMAAEAQEARLPYKLAAPPIDVPKAYYDAKSFDNSKLIPSLATIATVAGKPQTFDACGFVIGSTDEIWNKRNNVDAAIDKYFHEDYIDAGSWGKRIIGKKALREAVWGEMRAFPDIQIHITDCLCLGNDIDGYKCAMPDVLTGTNTGPSGYGPATGKPAKWAGMVQSYVKKNLETGQWQYYAEWGVHDEWALIQQLGLDFSRVPHPQTNSELLHDGEALLNFTGGRFKINKDDMAEKMLHDAERIPSA